MAVERDLVARRYFLKHFILQEKVADESIPQIIVLLKLLDELGVRLLSHDGFDALHRLGLQSSKDEHILMLVLQVFLLAFLVPAVVVYPGKVLG